MEFQGMSLLSADQFDREGLEQIFSLTGRMPKIAERKVRCQLLSGYILGSWFFEDSTRTRLGASTAFMRLGGSIHSHVNSKKETEAAEDGEVIMANSSMSKGESFEDTMIVLGHMCDIMVVRHPKVGQVAQAAHFSHKPTINAGNSIDEHPTQGLLDWYTIRKRKQELNGLTFALYGDLSNGRTVHSLSKILSLYQGVRFIFVAPDKLQMPKPIVADLREKGFQVDLTNDFEAALAEADIHYMTRIQQERFESKEEYESVRGMYVLTKELAARRIRSDSVIMHPGPVRDEISPDVYTMDQCAIREQVQNGILTKMALYLLILGKDNKLV